MFDSIIIFKAVTSEEEILIGNSWDFNAFQLSFGLPIDPLKCFYIKRSLFIKNLLFFTLYHAT